MKTKLLTLALFAFLFANPTKAQDVTTVNATNSDISDNLDLRAVASIFGDSKNLEDFERRLNDPKNQISNLDLNNDRMVDYLRVIEATEKNTHVIILQAVLDRDVFQDVATIEVERDRNNNVQVQVVGDVYMYGQNYIYEPVYVTRPVIYNVFWVNAYRPYYSPYYWNYYPTYYYGWAPYPVYRYRNNVNIHIHHHNQYNYVTTRRSSRAVALHSTRRADGYERQHPSRSFTQRNTVANRYELDQTRNSATTRTSTVKTNGGRNSGNTVNPQNNDSRTVRSTSTAPATRSTTKSSAPTRSQSGQVNNTTRSTRATATPTSPIVKTATTRTQSNQQVAPQRQNSNQAQRSTPSVQTRSTPASQTHATTAPTQRAQVAPQQRTAPAPKQSNGNSRSGNTGSRVNGRG